MPHTFVKQSLYFLIVIFEMGLGSGVGVGVGVGVWVGFGVGYDIPAQFASHIKRSQNFKESVLYGLQVFRQSR